MSAVDQVRLADCCEIVSGATPRTSDKSLWGGDIAWATPKDLSDLESKYISSTSQALTQKGYSSCSTKIMPPQSVLFSSRAPIGHVAINTVPMCTNQGFKSLVPDRGRVFPDYLYYWLRANKPLLQSLGNGATFKEVSKSVVAEVKVPLPPLAEQRRIAAILDKADALRAKRREAIAKLDQLLQSVFLDMFGDPVTNPKGWPIANIGDLASFVTSGSRGWAKYYANSGAKFIRIQNLVNGELDMSDCAFVTAPDSAEARRTKVRKGDVLVSITADLGRVAVVPAGIGSAHINQHIAILRLSGVEPAYAAHFLASAGGRHQFERLNREGVKAGLNFNDLRSLQILLPPVDLQRTYLSRVARQKELMSSLERSAVEVGDLFSSLQQRAFAGTL